MDCAGTRRSANVSNTTCTTCKIGAWRWTSGSCSKPSGRVSSARTRTESSCAKSHQSHFRRRIEAIWQANGADAAVRIDVHVADTVVAEGILPRQFRQIRRTEQRQANLSTVRVPGKL